ncbi:MAG TPA: serine hydrolase [Rugosimonospora sp.]|nr:serine hydrolase [Rugosimonospora sp.]
MTRAFRYPWVLGLAVLVVTLGSSAVAFGMFHHKKASASPQHSSAPSPSPTPSPSPVASVSPLASASPTTGQAAPENVSDVYSRLAAYLAPRGKHAAAGIVDLNTGARVLYNSGQQFETASIVKVDILSTLLWQLQNHNGHLSDSQRSLATSMITQSDNNAASALWTQIGRGTGLAAANKAFGLTHTTPGADGSWGLTRTTVADQLRLLTVVSTAGPLSAASRAYLLGLMNKVVKGQRWGVPSAAPADASAVYVKNGWLARSADGYRWIINTIGRIVADGHNWIVVVLSNYNTTMSGGISLVEKAANLAVGGLKGD